ncbi:MAG TPA: hypothetical protein VLB27_10085 [candidate division Zixibacteria bacterium]|nr:hypothetical protein [candidate division Zixibacteria bacterium]
MTFKHSLALTAALTASVTLTAPPAAAETAAISATATVSQPLGVSAGNIVLPTHCSLAAFLEFAERRYSRTLQAPTVTFQPEPQVVTIPLSTAFAGDELVARITTSDGSAPVLTLIYTEN